MKGKTREVLVNMAMVKMVEIKSGEIRAKILMDGVDVMKGKPEEIDRMFKKIHLELVREKSVRHDFGWVGGENSPE